MPFVCSLSPPLSFSFLEPTSFLHLFPEIVKAIVTGEKEDEEKGSGERHLPETP